MPNLSNIQINDFLSHVFMTLHKKTLIFENYHRYDKIKIDKSTLFGLQIFRFAYLCWNSYMYFWSPCCSFFSASFKNTFFTILFLIYGNMLRTFSCYSEMISYAILFIFVCYEVSSDYIFQFNKIDIILDHKTNRVIIVQYWHLSEGRRKLKNDGKMFCTTLLWTSFFTVVYFRYFQDSLYWESFFVRLIIYIYIYWKIEIIISHNISY